jgi:4-hydroxy-3-methylbut-2-enyl diphosphate reductase
MGCAAYLVDHVDQLEAHWFNDIRHIGLTAGASAPDELVQQVIHGLREMGAGELIELDGVQENITFSIPKELRLKDLG